MLRLRASALLLFVAGAACSATSTDDGAGAAAEAVHVAPGGSTDPIEHLKVIAGPEMNGRGTPSVGLSRAIVYVVDECRKAHLTGGLGADTYEQPFPLNGGQRSSNVLALRPGAGPHAQEIILVSAHLDHLGAGYPGADDNGSGSAAMLAIANQLTRPLDRTVGFLWTTGEEKGLLGSKYFVDHPPASVPLAAIAQEINLDALGALDDTRFSILPDSAPHTRVATTLLQQANGEMERPFTRMNQDLQAYTTRTDGYSFVRHDVPTVWVFEGLTNPNGGGSLMPRYHQPTDTLDAMIAENGGSKLRRMTELLTRTIEKLTETDFPPAPHSALR